VSGAPALGSAQLRALQELDGCLLANAIETFQVRLRNEGFADASVRCLFPELPPVVGYAATVRIRGSAPPVAGERYAERTDWLEYLERQPAPRLVVVEDVSAQVGLCSLVGEVHMSVLQALGCSAVLTNGSVRDIPAARAAGFGYFCGGVTVSHGYVHIVDFGAPVQIGGLAVRSGQLLHADLHGVQSIPGEIAAELPARGTAR
jgi:regulator of RNase E activity RraA